MLFVCLLVCLLVGWLVCLFVGWFVRLFVALFVGLLVCLSPKIIQVSPAQPGWSLAVLAFRQGQCFAA